MSLNQFQIKNGFGVTSYIGVLSLYRRRPDVETKIVEFDDWMTLKFHNKEKVEEQISFNIDFKIEHKHSPKKSIPYIISHTIL